MSNARIRIRRVYDTPTSDDGTRVLVDRIWPRGLSKEAAHLDDWIKTAAPSTELRKWYAHDPDKFPQFRTRYRAELAAPASRPAVAQLRQLAADRPLTLLTATRDIEHSHAAVLADVLAESESDEGGDDPCWSAQVCPSCGRFAEHDSPTECSYCGAERPIMS
jgi:uncharacterized protein YeaO (DUF488 family)